MEEVLDLAAQLRHLLRLDAQQRVAQVADHRLHALGARPAPASAPPALGQILEAPVELSRTST